MLTPGPSEEKIVRVHHDTQIEAVVEDKGKDAVFIDSSDEIVETGALTLEKPAI